MATTYLPPKHQLSKSTFMYGCQCPKRLWLHKYAPNLRDEMDEEQATIFQRGTNVGLLAQQLFPGGVNAAPPTAYDYQQSVADTARYIQQGHKIIYEAAFQHEGILCAIDILVNRNEKWFAYEVKSSTSVKPPYVQDAALQYNVITKTGIKLEDIFVTHLNSDYIRFGELDIPLLFKHSSVKEDVLELQPFINSKTIELKNVLTLTTAPVEEPGEQCAKPYPCDFFGYCSKDLPGEEPEKKFINEDAIQDFLSSFSYPLYFMDFETWIAPVPECDGHWSYRQIPFQYSVHVLESPTAELKQFSYLAEHPHSPMIDFAKNLISVMGKKGSVVVYNKPFENTILNHLKDDYPELNSSIENIQSRLVDLMTPFRKHYRLPEMQGSYSIKYVLPALVPELTYDDLTISNGADASTAFYNLQFETDGSKKEEVRKALLEYCGLDTLAMVRILEKLKLQADEY